jgi:hypothetical protein
VKLKPLFLVLALLLVTTGAQAQTVFFAKQSTAYTFTLPDLVAASDHVAGLTGATGTVRLVKVNTSAGTSSAAASTNSVTELDSTNNPGQYTLTLTTTETNTLGFIKGYWKTASSDPMSFTVVVVAYDPFDSVRLGLTALPNAAAGANTGLPLGNASGRVDVGNWLGSAPNALTSGRVDAIVGAYASGQAPLQPTTAGRTLDVSTGGEAGLDWANIGSPTTTVNLSGTTVGTATTLTNAPSDSSGTTTLLSRLTATRAGYLDNISTAAPTAATNAAAVWDLATSGHTTAGTFGAALNAAGSAGDPWATLLPGSYGAGTAGKIIGDNVNATISSRSSHSASDVWASGTRTLTSSLDPSAATIAAAVWDEARSGHVTSGTFGAGVIVQTNNDKTGYTASTVSDKTGYSLTQTFPSNFSLLAISGAGNVTVGGYLSGQDPATLLLAATVDSTLTVKQVFAIAQSILAGKYSTTLVGSTRTTTYKASGWDDYAGGLLREHRRSAGSDVDVLQSAVGGRNERG